MSEPLALKGQPEQVAYLPKARELKTQMLQQLERRWLPFIMKPIARFIAGTGISPNGLTILGFILTVGVGDVLSLGYLRIGGVLLLLTAIFDALDGTLACMSGRTSRFGRITR